MATTCNCNSNCNHCGTAPLQVIIIIMKNIPSGAIAIHSLWAVMVFKSVVSPSHINIDRTIDYPWHVPEKLKFLTIKL